MSTHPFPDSGSPFPPDPERKRRGCFFYGCIVAVVIGALILLLVGLATWATYRATSQFIEQYAEDKPAPIPVVERPEPEVKALGARIDAFADALSAGKATEPLSLTSDEINALIAAVPESQGRHRDRARRRQDPRAAQLPDRAARLPDRHPVPGQVPQRDRHDRRPARRRPPVPRDRRPRGEGQAGPRDTSWTLSAARTSPRASRRTPSSPRPSAGSNRSPSRTASSSSPRSPPPSPSRPSQTTRPNPPSPRSRPRRPSDGHPESEKRPTHPGLRPKPGPALLGIVQLAERDGRSENVARVGDRGSVRKRGAHGLTHGPGTTIGASPPPSGSLSREVYGLTPTWRTGPRSAVASSSTA